MAQIMKIRRCVKISSTNRWFTKWTDKKLSETVTLTLASRLAFLAVSNGPKNFILDIYS